MAHEITKQIRHFFEAYRAERRTFMDRTFQNALNDLSQRNMLFSSVASDKFADLYSKELNWRVDNSWALTKEYFNKHNLIFDSLNFGKIKSEIKDCIQIESNDLSNHAKSSLHLRRNMDYQGNINSALHRTQHNLNSKINGELCIYKQQYSGGSMDFDKMAYPEKVVIAGDEFKGQRSMSKGQMLIPYTDEPDVGIGDVISQKSGKREIHFKVLDVSFLEGGSLKVGTTHPHMLTLKIENTTAKPHITNKENSTFNIGSISGEQVQVGNQNTQVTNINIQQLLEHVAKSNDPEAKATMKDLLKNSTVASLIGAGASALLNLL